MNSLHYLYAAYIATWAIHGTYLWILARKYGRIRKELALITPLELADRSASADSPQFSTPTLSDRQILEKLERLQRSHLQAQAMKKRDSIRELIENVIPKLAHLQSRDSTRMFAVYHKSIGSPDLIILRACSDAEDLHDDLDALLQDYSVHVNDHYSVVVDAENRIASIAVHNKGSANGRVMNVFVWREPALYRFIGQRGSYTDSTGLTVGRKDP